MTMVLRILPPGVSVRRPHRLLERHWYAYRHQWLIILSGFFEPLFYLLSMRTGVGRLVGTVRFGGRDVPYVEFVAPALLAASAMNGAIFETTGNVFHRLRYVKMYDAVLATPLGSADVAVGEITFALIRGQLYTASFLVVMVALGLASSWWVLLALPACVLIGLAFAAVGFAGTTFMRHWADLDFVTLITMPMFLFSATFFPTSAYGSWAWVAQLSPLYHGVALIRAANAGVWTAAIPVHCAVLVALAVIGIAVSARRVERLLKK